MRKENGITLIALIITIIVMLILAGIAISLLLEEDGVINKAKQAVIEQKKAEREEKGELMNAELEMELLLSSSSQKTFVADDNIPGIDYVADTGVIYDFLIANDLIPYEEYVEIDENGKNAIIIYEPNIVSDFEATDNPEEILINIEIPCKNNSGEDVLANFTLNLNQDTSKTEIENVKVKYLSKVEKEIVDINIDIKENPAQYSSQGTSNSDREDKIRAGIIQLYTYYGFEIEDGYLNENKTDFVEDKLVPELGFGGYVSAKFTIPCSKDGEKVITEVQIEYLKDLKNTITRFAVKW